MGLIFLISWIIGILFCVATTIVAWQTKDKELIDLLPYGWVGMFLCGWILGIPILMLLIHLFFSEPRFK
jgi:hypothetical protein